MSLFLLVYNVDFRTSQFHLTDKSCMLSHLTNANQNQVNNFVLCNFGSDLYVIDQFHCKRANKLSKPDKSI